MSSKILNSEITRRHFQQGEGAIIRAFSWPCKISRSPIDSSTGGGFEKFMWGSEDDQLCGDDNSGYRGLTWHILDKCYKEVELRTFFISHQ